MNPFENLFVLEAANNHLGDVKRGLELISQHSEVVRKHSIKAAIKLQFRDVDEFIHRKFQDSEERYISKTKSTKLTKEEFGILVDKIKSSGCIPMATPFDESSVELCEYFEMPIVKIASSDCNDWPLIERIAKTRKPVIISSGGASEKDLDDIVTFFAKREIPLAVNHCVSLYPSEDEELELAQIRYLKERYPHNTVGLSTHEYASWDASMFISYGLGARTWERHIDIDHNASPVSKYCSLPHQIDRWFSSFTKAKEMTGSSYNQRRVVSKRETVYLDNLVRGVYAKRDIPSGYEISSDTFNKDFFLAIPLLKGQLSCRETLSGLVFDKDVKAERPITVSDIQSVYSNGIDMKMISSRGNDPDSF